MSLLHGFEQTGDYRGGYVAIGNFDGVHRGHQEIVAKLVERARQADVPSAVLTFDPHPVRLLRPAQSPPSLCTLEQKAELLEACGVDFVVAYPTNREFLSLSPDEFFDRIVRDEFQARGLVEGSNFCYGKDRAGDIETLRQRCQTDGLSLDVIPPVSIDGEVVSSSRIRELISQGNIAAAVKLLGHPYSVCGTVGQGSGRGADLGFPTANLDGIETLLPADGVYAGRVTLNKTDYPAAVHLGPNPTFGDAQRKLEVHVIGFDGDLYGQSIQVDFFDKIRDVAEFPDVKALRDQLEKDLGTAAGIFAAKEVKRKWESKR